MANSRNKEQDFASILGTPSGVKRSELKLAPAAQTPQDEITLLGEGLERVKDSSDVSPEAKARIIERGQVAGSRKAEALSRRATELRVARVNEHLVSIHALTGVSTVGEVGGKPIIVPKIETVFVQAPNRKKGLGIARHTVRTEIPDGADHLEAGDTSKVQGKEFVFEDPNHSAEAWKINPDIAYALKEGARDSLVEQDVKVKPESEPVDPYTLCRVQSEKAVGIGAMFWADVRGDNSVTGEEQAEYGITARDLRE